MQVVPLKLREACDADVDRLVDFACAMARETEGKRLDPDVVRRGIATVLAQPVRGRYLVAEVAGTVVATLMLTYEWSDWRCGDWWWIQSVYVEPGSRRRGAFRALYAQARALAAATPGVCGLRLYVERDNLAAQHTYATLGMQDTGYRVYEDGLPWLAAAIRKD